MKRCDDEQFLTEVICHGSMRWWFAPKLSIKLHNIGPVNHDFKKSISLQVVNSIKSQAIVSYFLQRLLAYSGAEIADFYSAPLDCSRAVAALMRNAIAATVVYFVSCGRGGSDGERF